jgi:SagB-type dehydrogenase family enzyme
MSAVERALAYHARTKHYPGRYARALGYLDWATQPDPFRVYAGAPRVLLPLLADGLDTRFVDLEHSTVAPRPLDLASVATLFELALGLSAWKEIRDSRWALRCNPSSGNLHPTEGYAVLPEIPGIAAGVYHYVSREHALERRCCPAEVGGDALGAALPPGAFLVGLSSIHWREAWKYGERAFRYCQHDVGHAIGAVRYAAATLGWSAALVDGLADADLAAILGLDREGDRASIDPLDREHPDAALLVCPLDLDARRAAAALAVRGPAVAASLRQGAWAGSANPLSESHVRWDVIDDVAEATYKPATSPGPEGGEPDLPPPIPRRAADVAASALIRARRSAVSFDGQTSIDVESFYAILDRLLPRRGRVPPWDALPWAPRVHVLLFIHRVRGLLPGLYAFERDAVVHDRLRAAMEPGLDWAVPDGCPEHLRLYRLAEGDLREVSKAVSCQQDIAADGAFSLGMIADFGGTIRDRGAPWYRRLFWEAGVLGHVLYLESEAASAPGVPVRGTGIGCYFDDAVHGLIGLEGDAFQSLYHFTVGGPVEDTRLATLPPYAHLTGR